MNSPRLVKDIYLGSPSSYPNHLLAFRNNLLFVASNGVSGREVWISDGSSTGTKIINDINSKTVVGRTGNSDSHPSHLTIMSDKVYFAASDGVSGRELWVTDGTATGTFLMADIQKGGGLSSSDPRYLLAIGNTLFFSANDGTSGNELWKTDGTAHVTVRISDINIGSSSSYPKYLVNIGNTLYFTADDGVSGRELWKSDGTVAGTTLVSDIWPGSTGSDPRYLTVLGNTLFFVANDGQKGRELWRSDGTSAGTVLIADITPGGAGEGPKNLTVFEDTIFFSADNVGSEYNRELWRTDGTAPGTVLVADIDSTRNGSPVHIWTTRASSNPSHLTVVNNLLFFSASSDLLGRELWKTDGTTEGTLLVNDLTPYTPGNPFVFSSSPLNLTKVGNDLYFSANGEGGREIWKTNGTASGTLRVADIGLGDFGRGSSNPELFTLVNNTLFFRATNNLNGVELWALDIEAETNTGSAAFTITGTPIVGNTLTATNRSPDPDGNGAFTYTWQTSTDGSNWSPVGTNSSSYLVVSADQGKQLRLDVSYTDGKGFSEAVTTAAGSVPLENDGSDASKAIIIGSPSQILQPISGVLDGGESIWYKFTLPVLDGKVGYYEPLSTTSLSILEGLSNDARYVYNPYELTVGLSGGATLQFLSSPAASTEETLFADGQYKKIRVGQQADEYYLKITAPLDYTEGTLPFTLSLGLSAISGNVISPNDIKEPVQISAYAAHGKSSLPIENLSAETWVIFHGLNSRPDTDRFQDLAQEIASQGKQVLLVDWRVPSTHLLPDDAARSIEDMASFVADSLTQAWGFSPSSLNFIGHSLGSYLAAETAGVLKSKTGENTNRLIALDPAITTKDGIGNSFSSFDISNNGSLKRFDSFSSDSNYSLALYGRQYQLLNGDGLGNPEAAQTATESYRVDFANDFNNAFSNHGSIVDFYRLLIDDNVTGRIADQFSLSLNSNSAQNRPWEVNIPGDEGYFGEIQFELNENGEPKAGVPKLTDQSFLETKLRDSIYTARYFQDNVLYYQGFLPFALQDGLIANASVFIDVNNNFLADPNEFSTQSLPDGSFTIILSEEQFSSISASSFNPIIVVKADNTSVDLSTDLPVNSYFAAPLDARIVTPLTTLIALLQQSGETKYSSQSLLRELFGISPDIDLLQYDPIIAATLGDSNSRPVFAGGASIQNLVAQISSFLDGITEEEDLLELTLAAFHGIKSTIKSQTLILNDVSSIRNVIEVAAFYAAVSISSDFQDALDAAAFIISDGQQLITELSAVSPADFLLDVARIQKVSQGAVRADLERLPGNPDDIASIVENTTGSSLANLIFAAQLGNLFPPVLESLLIEIPELTFLNDYPYASGTVIGSLFASDADVGPPNLQFSLDAEQEFLLDLDGDGINAFFINPLTGEVSLLDLDELDFENQSAYNLKVNVSDGVLSASATLTILLTDVNEAPTAVVFENAKYSLPENSDSSTKIWLGQVKILDDAIGSNFLSLEGADKAYFEIIDDSIFLKAGVDLDYSLKAAYNFNIYVDDASVGGVPDASVSFSLLVNPIDDGAASFTISGTPALGNTLTATTSSPDPDGNGEFTYSWQASTEGSTWNPVGTNSSSYLIASADQGKQLRLVVSYTDGQGFSEAVTTAGGSVPFVNDGAATFSISGTPAVGNTLTANTSSADPDGNGAFSYSWQSSTDGSIWSPVGTNSPSYLIGSTDQGKQLRLVVSYSDGQGFSEAVTTAGGSVPFVNDGSATFSISGTPAVGNTLTATTSAPDPDGNGVFTYSWQSSTNGTSWFVVGSESSLLITAALAGRHLRLQVVYRDAEGFDESIALPAGMILLPAGAPQQTVLITGLSDNLGILQGPVAEGDISNDTTPTLTGSLSAALGSSESLRVYRNGAAAGVAKVTGLSWSYTSSTPLSGNGTHSFTAAVVKTSGLTGQVSDPRSFVLDATSPSQTVTISAVSDDSDPVQGAVAPGGRSNDDTPTISGSLSAALGEGETLKLYSGSTFLADAVVDDSALSWSATPTLSTDGTYAITARVEDAAGNQGPASTRRSYILDRLAPLQTVSITGISDNVGTIQGPVAEGGLTNDTTPTLSGSLSAALGTAEVLRVYRDGVAAGNARVNSTNLTWSYTPATPLNANGTYAFTAAVVDGAGNVGALTATRSMVLDAPISTAQQDTLTGTSDGDFFLLPQLSWSLLGTSVDPTYDTITGFQSTDRIQLSGRTFNTRLTGSAGVVTSLSAAEIATRLTPAWAVNSARAFTAIGYAGTFVALNDAQAGYQAESDAILFLEGYNVSSTNGIGLV